ncbi:Acyl carrier protein, mitochondrial [Coniochaeta pulveracea]|uniref:Acyl carrier protein n=1 Tax=Coniochaeta pulveracea TaxID=177199 RepID=A0A420XZV1_9PEZI|nr:Acyl carrier protein, mitochondrial [Coniochaeta pulveracea]
MFRTAILRSAVRASAAVRPAVARSVVAPRMNFVVAAPRVALWSRGYAAAAGLQRQEVEDRIKALLQGFDKVQDPSKITSTSHFANDLGLDSLDTVEVVMAIEEEFSIEIPDKDADTIHSIDKAVEYICNQPDAN